LPSFNPLLLSRSELPPSLKKLPLSLGGLSPPILLGSATLLVGAFCRCSAGSFNLSRRRRERWKR
jgi:hypothetical protein